MSKSIKISYKELNDNLQRLMGVDLDDAIQDTLYASANILRYKAKQNLMAVTNAYNKPAHWGKVPRVSTAKKPLVFGIRVSRPNMKENSIMVHIMDREAFPLRFFEKGTKDRYQRTYRGKKLNPPRWLSKYKRMKLNFFHDATVQTQGVIFNKMEDRLSKKIQQLSNK